MRAILGKVVSKMIMNMMSLTAIVKIGNNYDDDDNDYSKDGDGNSNDSKKRGLPTGQPALTEQ